MKNNTKPAQRDLRIEIARIIGCLIVVIIHVRLNDIIDDQHDLSRMFISCLTSDGVAVFWLILGCFLFNEKNKYLSLIKRTFFRIVMPALILSAVLFVWDGFIKGSSTFTECISAVQWTDVKTALLVFLEFDNPVKAYGHFWYIYVYFLLILCFPAIKSFVRYLDGSFKRTGIFMTASLIFLIINDISLNRFAGFSFHAFNGALPAAIQVIWGHVIWKYREVIAAFFGRIKAWRFILFPVIFLGLNFLRLEIQMERYNLEMNNELMYWFSSIGLLCAVSIVVWCMCLPQGQHGFFSVSLMYIAKQTFYIYLFHIPVKFVLNRFGIIEKATSSINIQHWWGEVEYTVLAALIVFIASLVISMIISESVSAVKRLFRKKV